jgi:hypothetical protein
MNMIILALSTLSAFLLGSWVTYRAMQNKSSIQIPQIIKDTTDDLPGPISPYEEQEKARRIKVKI